MAMGEDHRLRHLRRSMCVAFILAGLCLFAAILMVALPDPMIPGPEGGWMWAGAVTDSSFVVVARAPKSLLTNYKIDKGGGNAPHAVRATLKVVGAADGKVYSTVSACTTPWDGPVSLRVPYGTLNKTTEYKYEVSFTAAKSLSNITNTTWAYDGQKGCAASPTYTNSFSTANLRDGRVRTVAPRGSPLSFSFAAGSCAATGSQNPVFTEILNELKDRQTLHERPAFFFHMGDLAYTDIKTDSFSQYKGMYESVMSSKVQRALFKQFPLFYMWDDHDFGPNNSDKDSPSRTSARRAYQTYFPHYPLAAATSTVAALPNSTGPYYEFPTAARSLPQEIPIHQRVDIGRTRFLVMDLRSESDSADGDVEENSMLGKVQKAWLEEQLTQAAADYETGKVGLLIISSSVPWISDSKDGWGSYSGERKYLAKFIEKLNPTFPRRIPIMMVSGDAHQLAFDDGSNTGQYAEVDSPRSRFPVVHAASLDADTSIKGGPYSHGCWDNTHQFAVFEVVDPLDPTPGRSVTGAESGRNKLDAPADGTETTTPCVKVSFYSNHETEPVFEYDTCNFQEAEEYPCDRHLGYAVGWWISTHRWFAFVFFVFGMVLLIVGVIHCFFFRREFRRLHSKATEEEKEHLELSSRSNNSSTSSAAEDDKESSDSSSSS